MTLTGPELSSGTGSDFEGLQFAIGEVGDELTHVFDGQVLNVTLELELLDVLLCGLDNAQSGEVVSSNSDEFSELFLDTFGDAGVGEKDLTLKFLGSFFESGLVRLVSVKEEDDASLLLMEDRLDGILIEFEKSGNSLSLEEALEILFGSGAGVSNWGRIEGAEDGGTGGIMDTGILGALSLSGVESVGVHGLSSGVESFEHGSFLFSVVDEVQLRICNLLLDFVTFDVLEGGTGLFHDPLNNGVFSAATSVLGVLSVGEPFEGWESFNVEALTGILVHGSINLGNIPRRILLGKDLSGLLILGVKSLAMTVHENA